MQTAAQKLADYIEEWDRICLEAGMGDWLDTHELPDHERALIIAALRAHEQIAKPVPIGLGMGISDE